MKKTKQNQSTEPPATGTLYIVATPIGNLEDITLRALRILKEVDLIAAEDTRHSKKLLNHYDIHTRLISYYREKEVERSRDLVQRLLAGENIALISDAGTPAISDPGTVLVRQSREAGIPVIPLPGPSALTAALSVAGLEDGTFLFLGFPPAKKNQRLSLLQGLVNSEHPVIFYESPRRIQALLKDCLKVLGNRQAFWGREMTKAYEEYQRADLDALIGSCKDRNIKGESVLIISPGKKIRPQGETIEDLLAWYHEHTDLSLKDVCRQLSADLGLSRSKVYKIALQIWKK